MPSSERVLAGSIAWEPVGTVYVAASAEGVIEIWLGAPNMTAFIAGVRERIRMMVVEEREFAADAAPILDKALAQLGEYFAGTRRAFDVPIDYRAMSDFQRRVYRAIIGIPAGRIESYNDIAHRLGDPKTIRAVGGALGRNPIPIIIPCHRIIGSDGTMIGYSGGGGVETKRLLLKMEGALLI
ncbi:MAG: methylated-DNA--[protein]-cysteine S-methyltransferase [Anaerolineae bacterium]